MIDYRLRVYHRFPQKQMRQTVVYLQPTTSECVQQTCFNLEKTFHEFEIIRLWEQPIEVFLQSPRLLPFAVLTQTDDRARTLQEVAQAVVNIGDRRIQNNIAASTAILAGLVLEKELIQRILRRGLMQESVIYQNILAEGKTEALEQGALNLLNEGIAAETVAKVTGLAIDHIRQLSVNHPVSE
jgi:predicted transposase/invertase (TIGR01784 family)